MDTNYLTTEIAIRQNFEKILNYWNMLPDPDPILRKRGLDITTYRELLTDPHLFSTIQQRKAGVLSQEWELQQLNSNEFEFNFIKDILNSLPLENIIDQILNAPLFGYVVLEIIWKKQGNYLIPERIEEKPQEWFFFDLNNQLNLKKNFNATLGRFEGEPINPLKFLLIQHKPTYSNPYGERLLSRCFWPITFKRGGLKFWITFTEKYGQPFLFGKLPRGSNQEDIDNLLNALNNMIQDAVAVIPDDSSIDILEASKTTSVEVFKQLLDFINQEISKAILTQTLTTEVGERGTYAASKTMETQLEKIHLADKRLVEAAINRLINLIYTINFNSNEKPKFILYQEQDVDKLLAERDQILVNTGIKFTKEYYIKNYNLAPEDFELNVNQVSSFAETQDFAYLTRDFLIQKAREKQEKLASEQTATDNIINQLPDSLLQLQIEPVLKPVLELIKKGENYDTIMEELAKTYPTMKTNQLEDLLTRLIFVAEAQGRESAQ